MVFFEVPGSFSLVVVDLLLRNFLEIGAFCLRRWQFVVVVFAVFEETICVVAWVIGDI